MKILAKSNANTNCIISIHKISLYFCMCIWSIQVNTNTDIFTLNTYIILAVRVTSTQLIERKSIDHPNKAGGAMRTIEQIYLWLEIINFKDYLDQNFHSSFTSSISLKSFRVVFKFLLHMWMKRTTSTEEKQTLTKQEESLGQYIIQGMVTIIRKDHKGQLVEAGMTAAQAYLSFLVLLEGKLFLHCYPNG